MKNNTRIRVNKPENSMLHGKIGYVYDSMEDNTIMIKVTLDFNGEVYKLYKDEVEEVKELNLNNVKTISTLEKRLLQELNNQDFENVEYDTYEAFTNSDKDKIKSIVANTLTFPTKCKLSKIERLANSLYCGEYDIEEHKDIEEIKYYLFMDYIECKFSNNKLTFNQFIENQLEQQ